MKYVQEAMWVFSCIVGVSKLVFYRKTYQLLSQRALEGGQEE